MKASEFPDFGAFLPDLVGPHACTVFLRKCTSSSPKKKAASSFSMM